jgi:hypothetical protein
LRDEARPKGARQGRESATALDDDHQLEQDRSTGNKGVVQPRDVAIKDIETAP